MSVDSCFLREGVFFSFLSSTKTARHSVFQLNTSDPLPLPGFRPMGPWMTWLTSASEPERRSVRRLFTPRSLLGVYCKNRSSGASLSDTDWGVGRVGSLMRGGMGGRSYQAPEMHGSDTYAPGQQRRGFTSGGDSLSEVIA